MRRYLAFCALLALLAVACSDEPSGVDAMAGAVAPAETSQSPEPSSSRVDESDESDDEPAPEVRVPKVTGKRIVTARSVLRRQGLDLLTRLAFSPRPRGTVLSQSPNPGAQLSPGSTINLTLAQPLPRIPGTLGKKFSTARSLLENAGFDVRVVREESSQAKDTVIDQFPEAGNQARPGKTVTLTVAKPIPAPEPAQAPAQNCTAGYSPCLPPASDYDCAGGSGDGPAYTGTVQVTGSDPYGLDSDNDGWGCE